jgi:hypothetical protein
MFSVYMKISKPKKTKTTYSQILQPYRYAKSRKEYCCAPLNRRQTNITAFTLTSYFQFVVLAANSVYIWKKAQTVLIQDKKYMGSPTT